MITNTKLYDTLKKVAQIYLPILSGFIFALSGVWGFDTTGKIVGTLAAVDAALGLFLQSSQTKYVVALQTLHAAHMANPENFDGDLIIAEGSGAYPELNAIWNEHPDEFKGKDTVTLRVQAHDLEPKAPQEGR